MDPGLNAVFLIIRSIENVVGIIISGFIVIVNFLDWVNGKILTTCDHILVALGTAYTCFQLSEVLSELYSKDHIILVLTLWTGITSGWFTTYLCVFYCLKIVDFNHAIYYWLKRRISKAVPGMILGSVVGSFLLIVPTILNVTGQKCTAYNKTANLTVISADIGWEFKVNLLNIFTYVLGYVLPLLVDIGSIALILTSLYRHTQRMKENSSEFSQPRLQAHFGAAKMVGSLLFIYISVFVSLCVELFSCNYWWNLVLVFLIATFSPAQSIILILGNAKLRGTLWKVLSLLKK